MDDLHPIMLLLPYCNAGVRCAKIDSYYQSLIVFGHYLLCGLHYKKIETIDDILLTDIFLSINLNYKQSLLTDSEIFITDEIGNTNFIYRQKKFVCNLNFFYRQIFPLVKEARNFPPKFELLTNFFVDKFVGTYITQNSSVKSVDNLIFLSRNLPTDLSVGKRSGNFPAQSSPYKKTRIRRKKEKKSKRRRREEKEKEEGEREEVEEGEREDEVEEGQEEEEGGGEEEEEEGEEEEKRGRRRRRQRW